MKDQVLKLKDIEDFFYAITCEMLNLVSELEKRNLRIAWQRDGSPDWNIDEDVAFIRITPQDDRMARQLDILYNPEDQDKVNVKKETAYTRVHKINWTLYGPNSYDNADLIRHLLFDTKYTREFKENNLALITDIPMPVRVPEYHKKMWWERTDFSATFNELVIRRSKVPFITGAKIIIEKNR